jgi:hypothetical protein
MKVNFTFSKKNQAGYSALLITMILSAAALLTLSGTLARTMTVARLNDRNIDYTYSDGAAEAAVEKVVSRLMTDFGNGGEGLVIGNLGLYRTGLLPSAAENSYWTNFTFSDACGHNNQIYAQRISTATNPVFMSLSQQYTGLSGYASTYRVLANVSTYNMPNQYAFTNAVQQDLQLAQIPVFQFAIFYNCLMEFSDTATMVVRGRVNANSNIYVGSPANLTFNSIVTASGNISSPGNAGYSSSTWTGTVSYNGTPSPGFLTGQPVLTLPIGTNNSASAVQQILYPPPAGESPTSAMGQQRYYNKADVILMVSNSSVSMTLQNTASDAFPVTNISYSSYSNWVNTNVEFMDQRENKWMLTTEIDVGQFTNWLGTFLATNSSTQGKFSSNVPLNVMYVADYRSTNNNQNTAVRLKNGANLPSAGLTVASPNPVYVLGNYNCPNSAYLGTTNTSASAPASIVCDAITILSPSWNDSQGNGSLSYRNASSDTVNAAFIAGIVPSTGTGSSQYSGGVNNYPRLLENWSSSTLTLNTSIVCLFQSASATGQFVLPGTYYYAPQLRQFSFDLNYMNAAKMPPGTPNICKVVRSQWCNPPPGVTNFTMPATIDFVYQ